MQIEKSNWFWKKCTTRKQVILESEQEKILNRFLVRIVTIMHHNSSIPMYYDTIIHMLIWSSLSHLQFWSFSTAVLILFFSTKLWEVTAEVEAPFAQFLHFCHLTWNECITETEFCSDEKVFTYSSVNKYSIFITGILLCILWMEKYVQFSDAFHGRVNFTTFTWKENTKKFVWNSDPLVERKIYKKKIYHIPLENVSKFRCILTLKSNIKLQI